MPRDPEDAEADDAWVLAFPAGAHQDAGQRLGARQPHDQIAGPRLTTVLPPAFEQARLDAVRNTPSFAYVDDPDGPVRDASRPVRDAAVWLVVGAGAVLIGLLLADWLDLLRAAQPESYAVLQQFAGLFRRRRKE